MVKRSALEGYRGVQRGTVGYRGVLGMTLVGVGKTFSARTPSAPGWFEYSAGVGVPCRVGVLYRVGGPYRVGVLYRVG